MTSIVTVSNFLLMDVFSRFLSKNLGAGLDCCLSEYVVN